MTDLTKELAAIQERVSKWPSEPQPYLTHCPEDWFDGNYDDAVERAFEAGIDYANQKSRTDVEWTARALQAVVDLHRSAGEGLGDPHPAFGDSWLCNECDNIWPCDTFRAIESAFQAGGAS